MDNAVWLPGLIVLGIGLTTGVLIALKLWRNAQGSRSNLTSADLLLKLSDLEKRRDELYDRIRRSRTNDQPGNETTNLEHESARALQDIDVVIQQIKALGGVVDEQLEDGRSGADRPPLSVDNQSRVNQDRSPKSTSSKSAVVGFVSGLSVASLIGILIYFALRDAQPRPEMESGVPTASAQAPHPSTEGLSESDIEQLDELLAQVLTEPSDLLARKQLALFQLSRSLFVEAFENSKEILVQSPNDPDGLYIQGVVRITMGQYELAINLLDQVLAEYPNHIQALLYRGIGFLQNGDSAQAIDTWEVALEVAGGSHPDIEYLLATAKSSPDRGPTTTSEVASTTLSGSARQNAFHLRIEIPDSETVAPSATLFVFLKTETAGPPVAVKRISNPQFPMTVTLGSEDAMISGTSLPTSGTLFVRLDSDGSASTKDESDMEAQIAATIDTPINLELKP